MIIDTIEKTLEQRLKPFGDSIAFRSAEDKNNISEEIKNKMNYLLDELRKLFEKDNFYYTITVMYYIANK